MSAAQTIRDWTSYTIHPSDGETVCGSCDEESRTGDPFYWTRPHYEYGDCDAYCETCALEIAENNRAVVEALERGEIQP